MRYLSITRTQFQVNDFLQWQKNETLRLSPRFQRRPVWRPDAKSYFIDTVVRGLPAPIIYVREKIDLDAQETIREVIDGQQRLRTLFAYINPEVLPDYNAEADEWQVKKSHNKELAGRNFEDLPDKYKKRILGYQFSTHILPSEAEDRDVLKIFARLNATGYKLNRQELRNAQYFGEFKMLSYELAYEQLERWTDWRVFNDHQVSRMKEVELTSDLLLNMLEGLTGKSQKTLDDAYEKYDDEIANGSILADRFRKVMDTIDSTLGEKVGKTKYRSKVFFFSLFIFLYDYMWGLGSKLSKEKGESLPGGIGPCLESVSKEFQEENVPEDVLDAVQRASTDLGRRQTRLDYLREICG